MKGAARDLLLALFTASTLPGCLEPSCKQPAQAPSAEAGVRVLSYNVGSSLADEPYALRLRDQAYEDFVGERIRARKADIVMLQEVLPPTLCNSFSERNKQRTCFANDERPAAAVRLLGPDYTVVCDANKHIECIGVRNSFATVRSQAKGAFVLDGAKTEPLPGKSCNGATGACDARSEQCDAEASISTVVIDTASGPLRLVHAHPTAVGESCLQKQVEQAFALADDLPTLLAGDWNFDPTRAVDLAPASLWFDQVGDGQRFNNHSRFTKTCRMERTSVSQDASLDRVVTDFGKGRCRVFSAPRLDEGFDFDKLDGSRIDHFAVECDLSLGSL